MNGDLFRRLSCFLALAVLPRGWQKPSQELFEFSGTLKATALTGTLKRPDLRQPSRLGSRELPAGSFAEWKHQVDDILKYRGPKW